MQQTKTLTLTKEQMDHLHQTYLPYIKHPNPNALWTIFLTDCTITAYPSGKVVFQGKEIDFYIQTLQQKTVILPQAGSDEVGTGDYFGPVVVCASYIDDTIYGDLRSFAIQDSKSLSDQQILKIGQPLMEMVPHSLLILPNTKYNQVHQTNNLNQIKAKLHNQAYVHLFEKVEQPKLTVVDQFAKESLYYRYLEHEQKVIRQLHFETKAEDQYIAVGCSSIIARYAFLMYFQKMEEQYQFHFVKGAGPLVDQAATQFVQQFGFDALNKVAKLHFKNTENIKR